MSSLDEGSNGVKPPTQSWLPGAGFLFVALVLFGAVWLGGTPVAPLGRLLYQLSAIFLLCGAALLAASLTAAARRRGTPERHIFARRGANPLLEPFETLRTLYDQLLPVLANIDWRGDWYPILAASLPSLLALYAIYGAWTIVGPNPTAAFDEWVAAGLIIAAFPALVFERHLAQLSERRVPDAPSLARLFRVPILAFLALGAAAGLRWLGISQWPLVEHFADFVVGLIAAEIVLRAAAFVFIPLPPIDTRKSPADSVIAGLIRLQRPNLAAFNATVRDRLGIDFARSWALAYIRRAALPVLMIMALFCWLLTGVTALGLNERAVYEAFGRPQAVFTPGLHLHLPWPFGVLRPVEYGVVREIPIVFAANGSVAADQTDEFQARGGDIEGAPPPSADRLWTADHPSEASYLVASVSNGRQNFEVADIDLRIVYRIGLSDGAALAAVYNVSSPETMVRASAGRMLARYFARYTIADVLGQNREAFIRGFQRELQARLAALNTGIEVMAVVVEAIHPPSGAAASYQGVQAAAIRAQVLIATARANAVTEVKQAQQTATTTRDEAVAAAAERVDAAKAATALFAGDRQAYASGGASFVFERRLEHLDKALAKLPLTIIDHRISRDDALTLDQRPSASAYVPEEQ
ncbi:MAG TPA: SPFH domain-containing protein [Rhizomicrobium sp.]|nr:SPFH domain-containing protein [Rhizomicrobium sp.]